MSMNDNDTRELNEQSGSDLFKRVVAILDQAKINVVRSVNTNMVLAYWLIGREIVQEFQGADRAEYGKQVVETLSEQLLSAYGKGYSVANLKNFRQFYIVYSGRTPIRYLTGSETAYDTKRHPVGSELAVGTTPVGFSPQLSWSHYRVLVRVQDSDARDFYEREAAECGWTKAQLERQIQSSYFQRIITNRGAAGLVAAEDRFKMPGDNPTIGLIHCSDKSEAVAKCSVLSEGRQIFASKYLQFLPSEQELMLEIEREHKLIEAAFEGNNGGELI